MEVAGLPGMQITSDHATVKKQMFTISVVESLPQMNETDQ